jgi:hypothetical protein
MSAQRVQCPHCRGEIRLDVTLEAVGYVHRGPTPSNLGPEVEKFIIDGIEIYRSSFAVVGKLLEEKGILTPKGHRRWFAASVKREYEKAVARRNAVKT